MRMHDWPSRVSDTSEAEWLLAEQAERIERLEMQLGALTAERERREIELVIARFWVKELALWFDDIHVRPTETALTTLRADLAEPTLSWETLGRFAETREAPLARRTLVIIGLLAALAWATVVGLAYAIWLLIA